ncbi:hypothetical protein MRX96_008377 [Rhipicephalus microplus]
MPTKAPTPPPTTARTTAATAASTPFSWVGIPSNCVSPSPPPHEPLQYTVGPTPTIVAAPNRSERPIFCLFDNSKVRHLRVLGYQYDYTFEMLPLALCPNVVYASVGIVDGHLRNRLPRFDQSHGLTQLRNIVNTLGYNDTRILLMLGGREQDAPHFWRLGRDPPTLDLLMRNVADYMRMYKPRRRHRLLGGPHISL